METGDDRAALRARVGACLEGHEEDSDALFAVHLDRAIEADARGAFMWVAEQRSKALLRKVARCGGSRVPDPAERIKLVLSSAVDVGAHKLAAYACTLLDRGVSATPLVLCFASIDTDDTDGNLWFHYGDDLQRALELSASLCATMPHPHSEEDERVESRVRVAEFDTKHDMEEAKLAFEWTLDHVSEDKISSGRVEVLVPATHRILEALEVQDWGWRYVPRKAVPIYPAKCGKGPHFGLADHLGDPVCDAAGALPYQKRALAFLLMEGRKDDAESAMAKGWVPRPREWSLQEVVNVLGMCEYGSSDEAPECSQRLLLGLHATGAPDPGVFFRLSGGEDAELVCALVGAVAVWADFPHSGDFFDASRFPDDLLARVCATYSNRGDDPDTYAALRARVSPDTVDRAEPFVRCQLEE